MMGKRFNKKGFTLVELLAVIVVLAILVLLAMPRVTSMMEKSRVNSFAVEANEILKVAQTAYNDHLLNGVDDGTMPCYTVDELIADGYLDKDKGEIVGAIVLEIPDPAATDQSVKTHMYLSKGDYYMKNVATKAKSTDVHKASNLYSDCTGSGTVTCTATGTNAATVQCGSTTISSLPNT